MKWSSGIITTNSPVLLKLDKTCNVFKAAIGKSHKYIKVSERLLYRSQRGWERPEQCCHCSILSEGTGAYRQLVQGSLIPWKSIVLLPSCVTRAPCISPSAWCTSVWLLPRLWMWEKRHSPCPDGVEPFPEDSSAFQELDLQSQTPEAPEPWLGTLGTHLLVMLPHRFSGVTGAEWGPLCPTQVTEETAAITQISLSHSNYLTALASRHVFSCSPRALESSSTERCKAVFCRNENHSLHLYGSTYYISKHRET